jgi:hypothetical protein
MSSVVDNVSDWLVSITAPMVTRVLAALGLGTVTYTGASAALSSALSAAKVAFTGMTGEVLQILAMTGFFDAAAITAGGITGALGWMILKHFALQSGT